MDGRAAHRHGTRSESERWQRPFQGHVDDVSLPLSMTIDRPHALPVRPSERSLGRLGTVRRSASSQAHPHQLPSTSSARTRWGRLMQALRVLGMFTGRVSVALGASKRASLRAHSAEDGKRGRASPRLEPAVRSTWQPRPRRPVLRLPRESLAIWNDHVDHDPACISRPSTNPPRSPAPLTPPPSSTRPLIPALQIHRLEL